MFRDRFHGRGRIAIYISNWNFETAKSAFASLLFVDILRPLSGKGLRFGGRMSTFCAPLNVSCPSLTELQYLLIHG